MAVRTYVTDANANHTVNGGERSRASLLLQQWDEEEKEEEEKE